MKPAIPLCSFHLGRPQDPQQQAFGKLWCGSTQGSSQGTQLQVPTGDADLARRGAPSELHERGRVRLGAHTCAAQRAASSEQD